MFSPELVHQTRQRTDINNRIDIYITLSPSHFWTGVHVHMQT